jgi:hypothetical protein
MVKTRSQAGNITIKKEEEDDKPTLLLNGANSTRSNTRITKRKPSRTLSTQQVKVEQDTDNKSLLKLTSHSSKLQRRQRVSQEQINQLVDYAVNHNMSIVKASRKVNIGRSTGHRYYNIYKNDPDKKIPSPQPPAMYTQEQIGNLVGYIHRNKMTVDEASAKANLTFASGHYYYNKYLEDPNHNIPIPKVSPYYSQDQRDKFISFIVNDKMSVVAASEKAKLSVKAAKRYYHKYFNVQNPDIPTPSHVPIIKKYTQKQIKQLISCIVNDKMTVTAASRKSNMCGNSAGIYYRKYLKDNNMEIPVPKNKRCTQDEINKVIGYIVDDKMTILDAAKKANMSGPTGGKYYRQYLRDRNIEVPIPKRYTQEQKSELIRSIVDDKMTIMEASKKANMSYKSAHKYYRSIHT